jgi:hypothetical protein
MLVEQTKGCDLSKGDQLVADKKMYIPSPLFGIFDFFCLFQNFNELEKEKKNVKLQRRNECHEKKN